MRELALVATLALAACTFGCGHSSDARDGEDADDIGGVAKAKQDQPPIVIFQPKGKDRTAVLVEVVKTRAAIQQGLMYRKQMDQSRGMLFLMGEEKVHSFWMRNTYIALDMIFIDRNHIVVGVVENAKPLTDDSRTVGLPSSYVVEVNAGWASKHGVAAGIKVRFKNVRE